MYLKKKMYLLIISLLIIQSFFEIIFYYDYLLPSIDTIFQFGKLKNFIENGIPFYEYYPNSNVGWDKFDIFEFLLIPIVPISFLIQTILYNTNAILSHLFSILLLFFGFFAKTSDFLTFHKLSEMGSIELYKNYTINDLISTNSFNLNSSFYEFESYTALFKKNGIRFDPDFIHANDLSTLMAGYEIKKMTNAKLIYDSHELELDKNKFFPK